MNPLKSRIIAEIDANGPMPVSVYMAHCLLDPDHGYYTNRTPFGTEGDFITAPEISQMFGELIGIWLFNTWQHIGSPDRFAVVELGPGRGTLIKDIARATKNHEAFTASSEIHLVEASPALRKQQSEALAELGRSAHFHDTLDTFPNVPLLVFGNEFLDALPIRQFVKTGPAWHERCVISPDGETLAFGLGAAVPSRDLLPSGADEAADGTIYEYAPAREAIGAQLGAQICHQGGAALLIDYGYAKSAFGDTLQAVRAHHFVNPLDEPGQADLTSHVDFERIAEAAKIGGACAHPLINQGNFLLKMGLLERAGQLGHSKSVAIQAEIQSAVNRLAGDGDNQMGQLFKVLCLSQNQPAPFPFVP